ncbi:MAG: type VI secretion system tube protein Hcp [Pseudomonadota bacterium]
MPIMMKFEGSDGAVDAAGYEKYILLEDVEWGIERNLDSVGADANQRARPTTQHLKVVKMMDLSTSGLLTELLTGKLNRSVTIDWVRTNKTGNLEAYVRITLTDATITKWKLAMAGDRPVDTFMLGFKQFELKTWAWSNDAAGTSSSVGYDIYGGR